MSTPSQYARTEASRILDLLARIPTCVGIAQSYAVVRAIMLQTEGWMLAQGEMYDVRHRHLGGGVYHISLVRKEFA